MAKSGQEAGFTLVELVLVIAILAIIAVAATSNVGNMTGMKTTATARKLQSDIVYAQELAMSRGQPYRVYFNGAPAPGSGYAVVNDDDGDGTWGEGGEFAQDPPSGGGLSVTLNAGNYAGITISGVGFAGSFVEFNTLGVPFDGNGKLAAAGSVTLSGGGANPTVAVQAETGMVSTP